MSLILAFIAGGIPLLIVVAIFLVLIGAFGNKKQKEDVSKDLGCGCFILIGLVVGILFLVSSIK